VEVQPVGLLLSSRSHHLLIAAIPSAAPFGGFAADVEEAVLGKSGRLYEMVKAPQVADSVSLFKSWRRGFLAPHTVLAVKQGQFATHQSGLGTYPLQFVSQVSPVVGSEGQAVIDEVCFADLSFNGLTPAW
jgi:hypothetical protein